MLTGCQHATHLWSIESGFVAACAGPQDAQELFAGPFNTHTHVDERYALSF